MKRAGVRVGTGTRFAYDGEVVEVVELLPVGGLAEVLARDLRTDTVRRFALRELMSERSHLLSEDLVDEVGDDAAGETAAVKWAAAPESARSQARERAVHVREALTGYRSGSELAALFGEPRARYKTTLPKQARLAAKAKELGIGFRTVQRWVSRYEAEGEVGLISDKAVQPALGSKTFELFEQAALDVMREHTDMSRPTRNYVTAHAQARLTATYGDGAVRLPSPATAYRILEKLERVHPLFSKSTKRNRDIAARPVSPYGKLHPSRPGEYLLMDTTHLDVFAMAGVIAGYAPHIGVAAAGFGVQAFVTLEIAQGALDTVAEELEALPGVLEAFATTGSGDVLCRIAAASHEGLQQTLIALNKTASVTRSTSVIALSVVVPYRSMPLLNTLNPGQSSRAPAYRKGPH